MRGIGEVVSGERGIDLVVCNNIQYYSRIDLKVEGILLTKKFSSHV